MWRMMLFAAETGDYSWLEKASDNDTGHGIFNELFRGGRVAGLYRLFLIVGFAIFVVYLIAMCIKALLYSGDMMTRREFKMYLGRWGMCLAAFCCIELIVFIALRLGGAL